MKGNIPNKRRRHSHRHGAAAVEFALVAPLFLLLLGGIIEFGQAFRIQHALSNAARRGARCAIVDGHTSIEVSEKVKAQCAETLGVAEEDLDVTVAVNGTPDGDLSTAEEGDEVSVTVSIPYSRAGVGFLVNTFSNSVLESTCILEHE